MYLQRYYFIFFLVGYMKKTTIAYKATFRHHFIQGMVTEIDFQGKKVTIGNGDGMEILLYTDLVIAVGSRGPMPGKIFERRAEDASRKYRELGNEVYFNFALHQMLEAKYIMILKPFSLSSRIFFKWYCTDRQGNQRDDCWRRSSGGGTGGRNRRTIFCQASFYHTQAVIFGVSIVRRSVSEKSKKRP